MGKKSGKKAAKKAARVENWAVEGNDDDSFASHSRRTLDEDDGDHDDLVYSVSRSRSISFIAVPRPDEEDRTDSQRSENLNGLVARGSPKLARSSLLAPPTEEPYRDTLSTRSQRQRTFDIIQFSDDDDAKSVELDGLLMEEIEPFEKNKRRSSLCCRNTVLLAVAGVIGVVTTFGAIEYQKRTTNNLRGNGTNYHRAPSAEALFGTHSSMTNTHGLDVHAGEIGQSSMTNTHGLDVHSGDIGVSSMTNSHGLDMNDAEINNCLDNLDFQHDNGQNCMWAAQATAQRCANERVLNNCRATCDPSCGGNGWSDYDEDKAFDDDGFTEFPTEEPTFYPTLFPSEAVSSWETEDMTDEFSKDSN